LLTLIDEGQARSARPVARRDSAYYMYGLVPKKILRLVYEPFYLAIYIFVTFYKIIKPN
jgi:hypothetical protein